MFAERPISTNPLYQFKHTPLAACVNDVVSIAFDNGYIARFFATQSNAVNLKDGKLTDHQGKITAICDRGNNLFVSADLQNLKLYDTRNWGNVHTFKREGGRFMSVDIAEHILIAANGKKLTFFDLRKMKQRAQFTQSFNDDISHVQFDRGTPTILMACSMDGLVDRFDLTQPNQEESFIWGHKIMQSPSKLHFISNSTLIQTSDHSTILLDGQSLASKHLFNTIDNPTHILHSSLVQSTHTHPHTQVYTYNLKESVVEYHRDGKLKGFIDNAVRVQLLVPWVGGAVYSDNQGRVYYSGRVKQISGERMHANFEDYQKIEEFQPQNNSKQTGYIISKPNSLKDKSKKFKPF